MIVKKLAVGGVLFIAGILGTMYSPVSIPNGEVFLNQLMTSMFSMAGQMNSSINPPLLPTDAKTTTSIVFFAKICCDGLILAGLGVMVYGVLASSKRGKPIEEFSQLAIHDSINLIEPDKPKKITSQPQSQQLQNNDKSSYPVF